MADADVAGREIDSRNAERGQEGTFRPKRRAGYAAAIRPVAADHLLQQPDALSLRIDLESLPADLMIATGRVGKRDADLGMGNRTAHGCFQLVACGGQAFARA